MNRIIIIIFFLLPTLIKAAGLGPYNPAQHAVNGFMPTQLPGCYLWLRAETCGLSSGDNVVDVQDFSKNGMLAVRGSDSATPVISIENGRKSFKFDGVNDYLIITNFSSFNASWSNGVSVFIVSRWTTKAWTGNYSTDLQALIDNEHASYACFVIQDRPDQANSPTQFYRGSASGGSSAYTSTNIGDGKLCVISAVHQLTNSYIYYNNKLSGTGSGGVITNAIRAKLNLGYYNDSYGGTGRYLNGVIAECIIVHDTLSDANISQLARYLGTKYGIVVQ